ncbi:hypothetical protein AB1Y20_019745 [Prymnesium parvum]|uniref:DUF218 domain-containing protein n=1 Tax=Prymnesium parvum TaxID=97485 RepID=A0AB34JSQ1_PRYPA
MKFRKHETVLLDRVIQFLSLSEPWFPSVGSYEHFTRDERTPTIIAVCGNWYDLPHKAAEVALAARALPSSEVLLTGGRAERLTPSAAVQLGGEPVLLHRELHLRYGISPSRMILWTGSRVTTHNLRVVLHYAKQLHEFGSRPARLLMLEEGFLVRREAATLASLLGRDAEAQACLKQVVFQRVGATSFGELVKLHSGRTDVALALLLGELDRLRRYTRQGNATTSTHGTIARGALFDHKALRALDSNLASAIVKLQARHEVGLLASGKRILEALPREDMLRMASPTAGAASRAEYNEGTSASSRWLQINSSRFLSH